MLSLGRRPGQKVRIGKNIIITINKVRGDNVTLGIEAPRSEKVLREELHQAGLIHDHELDSTELSEMEEEGSKPKSGDNDRGTDGPWEVRDY